jgi:hypothetical protein
MFGELNRGHSYLAKRHRAKSIESLDPRPKRRRHDRRHHSRQRFRLQVS